MNKILIGAGIGAIVGYLVADWYIEFVMPTNCDEEETARYPYRDIVPEEEEPIMFNHDRNVKPLGKAHMKKDYAAHFVASDRPDIAQLAAKYKGEIPEEPLVVVPGNEVTEMWDEELSDLPSYDHKEEPDITIISMEEYATDDDLDHVTWSYYADDVVTDETNTVVPSPEKVLGDDALVSFGGFSQDEDTVYVRNNATQTMYEVVRTEKTYTPPASGRRLTLKERRDLKKGMSDGEKEENS